MPSIADTIRRLQAAHVPASDASTRLRPLTGFDNPGALKGWFHAPGGLAKAGLVVVLHGCTQTAAGYDRGAGWSELAERHGFAVLFPEQQRGNNANLCFNWFSEGDTRRGGGEAASIRAMVGAMLAAYPIDPARVFVTGLSAGGAMAGAMLAAYPDVFAGGGIIAGLPYASATDVPQAFERMRGQGHAAAATAAARVRAASSHAGPWPSVSVWHGDADATVSPTNADRIVEQWQGVHGTGAAPDRVDRVDGHPRRLWLDGEGRMVIEDIRVGRMGHGTPLATDGPDAGGAAGPFMLDVGVSSTRHLARRWGLLSDTVREPVATRPTRMPDAAVPSPASTSGVQATIEHALRAAGLMK